MWKNCFGTELAHDLHVGRGDAAWTMKNRPPLKTAAGCDKVWLETPRAQILLGGLSLQFCKLV